jgi:hypothetical protein
MAEKAPRWIPIVWAIIEFSAVGAIIFFWRPKDGTFWWYVRAVPFALLSYMGIQSLWCGFFASNATVQRRVRGDFKD